MFFRVGAAMEIWQSNLVQVTSSIDAIVPSDNSEVINAGCELSYSRFIFLRAGYKSIFRDESEEGLTLDWFAIAVLRCDRLGSRLWFRRFRIV